MATFLNDTFTDTDGVLLENHTGETGATWAKQATETGSAVIAANRVRANVNFDVGWYYASGTPTTNEYDVIATIRVLSAVSSLVGPAGRMATGAVTEYTFWYDASPGSSQWLLEKRVAGVATTLGTYSQTLNNAQDYTAKLEIRNVQKAGYVDGVQRITSTDDAITAAGKAGAIWYSATLTDSTGTHIGDILGVDAPPPLPIIRQQAVKRAATW